MNVTSHAQHMSSKGSSTYSARQRARQRRRRQEQQPSTTRQPPSLDRVAVENSPSGGARRAAATTCGWCRAAITPRSRGPIPKWCSATCRHRAWEQSRAAASGRCAVEIVERVVTVPARPLPVSKARQLGWLDVLRELATQVEQGAVYDRHLPAIDTALGDVLRAVYRRSHPSPGRPSPRRWG
jgi:hypothetical protein